MADAASKAALISKIVAATAAAAPTAPARVVTTAANAAANAATKAVAKGKGSTVVVWIILAAAILGLLGLGTWWILTKDDAKTAAAKAAKAAKAAQAAQAVQAVQAQADAAAQAQARSVTSQQQQQDSAMAAQQQQQFDAAQRQLDSDRATLEKQFAANEAALQRQREEGNASVAAAQAAAQAQLTEDARARQEELTAREQQQAADVAGYKRQSPYVINTVPSSTPSSGFSTAAPIDQTGMTPMTTPTTYPGTTAPYTDAGSGAVSAPGTAPYVDPNAGTTSAPYVDPNAGTTTPAPYVDPNAGTSPAPYVDPNAGTTTPYVDPATGATAGADIPKDAAGNSLVSKPAKPGTLCKNASALNGWGWGWGKTSKGTVLCTEAALKADKKVSAEYDILIKSLGYNSHWYNGMVCKTADNTQCVAPWEPVGRALLDSRQKGLDVGVKALQANGYTSWNSKNGKLCKPNTTTCLGTWEAGAKNMIDAQKLKDAGYTATKGSDGKWTWCKGTGASRKCLLTVAEITAVLNASKLPAATLISKFTDQSKKCPFKSTDGNWYQIGTDANLCCEKTNYSATGRRCQEMGKTGFAPIAATIANYGKPAAAAASTACQLDTSRIPKDRKWDWESGTWYGKYKLWIEGNFVPKFALHYRLGNGPNVVQDGVNKNTIPGYWYSCSPFKTAANAAYTPGADARAVVAGGAGADAEYKCYITKNGNKTFITKPNTGTKSTFTSKSTNPAELNKLCHSSKICLPTATDCVAEKITKPAASAPAGAGAGGSTRNATPPTTLPVPSNVCKGGGTPLLDYVKILTIKQTEPEKGSNYDPVPRWEWETPGVGSSRFWVSTKTVEQHETTIYYRDNPNGFRKYLYNAPGPGPKSNKVNYSGELGIWFSCSSFKVDASGNYNSGVKVPPSGVVGVPVKTPAGKGKLYQCRSNTGAVKTGFFSDLTDSTALNKVCAPTSEGGKGYCTVADRCIAEEVKRSVVKAAPGTSTSAPAPVTSCPDGRLLYKTSGKQICSAKKPGIEYLPGIGFQLAGYANKTACYDKKDGKRLGYLGNGSYPLATNQTLWKANTRFGALYGDAGDQQLLMCPVGMDTGAKCPKDKPYWSKNGKPAPQCVPCPVTQPTGWGWNCSAANAGNKPTNVSTASTTTVPGSAPKGTNNASVKAATTAPGTGNNCYMKATGNWVGYSTDCNSYDSCKDNKCTTNEASAKAAQASTGTVAGIPPKGTKNCFVTSTKQYVGFSANCNAYNTRCKSNSCTATIDSSFTVKQPPVSNLTAAQDAAAAAKAAAAKAAATDAAALKKQRICAFIKNHITTQTAIKINAGKTYDFFVEREASSPYNGYYDWEIKVDNDYWEPPVDQTGLTEALWAALNDFGYADASKRTTSNVYYGDNYDTYKRHDPSQGNFYIGIKKDKYWPKNSFCS